ncbi:uncharacterized protein LOC114544373 [Dendronephthya gigantea]|uniref:uncharacterized protein LOC114544373 n=1 Tax=Dendronephthya gigantea TaxID=151771 RepID=UPI00106AFE02|nr:uncharacterized protein LOC114544373 [Dendronephthya gigantea]
MRLPQHSLPTPTIPPNISLATSAAYIACYVLIKLGYFVNLKKSSLVPQLTVPFLGFLSDAVRQAFILPQNKIEKFSLLRESILAKKSVSLQNLQKLGGKIISFTIAVPAARLYAFAIFHATSVALSTGRPVPLKGALLEEISSWRFLDSWSGFLPWREEQHIRLHLYSDASNAGWAGIIHFPDETPTTVKGPWGDHERLAPITVREALALVHTLHAVSDRLTNARLDCYVDSLVLVHAWQHQGSRSPALANALKQLFSIAFTHNFVLTLFHIPGSENPADHPSRQLSDIDCTLSSAAWHEVERAFGPHTIDLMALPANVVSAPSGQPLKFFSPFYTEQAAGVNVFAQLISPLENAYVFPPFTLIGPLIKFLNQQHVSYTIIAPDISPRRYWWPLLLNLASASFCLGNKGDTSILRFPSYTKEGFTPRPLQCGFNKELPSTSAPPRVRIDFPSINARLSLLHATRNEKPYQKQKSQLQTQFEAFMASLPSPKSILSATPEDIIRFLIWRDQFGKTVIHHRICPHFGVRDRQPPCDCPRRLAANTVDNNIAKLRTIFLSARRPDQISDGLPPYNPAAHPSVKQYLASICEEQAKATISPKQATPLFHDKFKVLCTHLHQRIRQHDLSPTLCYLYARDLGFFSIDFYSGSRASDLGRIHTKQVLTLPDSGGFLFRQTFGKTLRNRLHLHLTTLHINDGETAHSFRSGCSITLSLLGFSDQDIAQHVGWKSTSTARYYSNTHQVLHPSTTTTLLTEATSQVDIPHASAIGTSFRARNNLVNMSLAFP